MTSITHQHSKCTAWRVDPGLIQDWSRVDPELIPEAQFDIQDTAWGVTPELLQGWSRLVPEAPIWNTWHSLGLFHQQPPHDPSMTFYALLWPSWPLMTPIMPLFSFFCPYDTLCLHAPCPIFILWLTMPIMLTHPMPLFQILPPMTHYDSLWLTHP